MKRAVVFPGQGSQIVGMGKDLAGAFGSAKLVFQEVDEALGQHLSRILFEGPEDMLTLTENAQPAIMASSIALLRVLEKETGFHLPTYAAYVARPFARRIYGALCCRRANACRHCPPAETARAGDAKSRAAGRGCNGGHLRPSNSRR